MVDNLTPIHLLSSFNLYQPTTTQIVYGRDMLISL